MGARTCRYCNKDLEPDPDIPHPITCGSEECVHAFLCDTIPGPDYSHGSLTEDDRYDSLANQLDRHFDKEGGRKNEV